MPSTPSRDVVLVAVREARILWRSRAGRSVAFLIFALAWLPPLLVAGRSGRLGLASLDQSAPLTLALSGVLVPLLALLAGCGLFATEIEERSIVPVLAAPVSRRALVAGKLLGLASVLVIVYAAAFLSVGVTVNLVQGAAGRFDYLAVVVSGALLGASCILVGAALGASSRGRVRAYGASLASWLVLVFVLDAVLLALVLSTSPPPPASVGHHGHDEIAAIGTNDAATVSSVLWMAAGPVDLFRLTALTFAPELGAPWTDIVHGDTRFVFSTIAAGWMLWLAVPAAVVFFRFRRVSLS